HISKEQLEIEGLVKWEQNTHKLEELEGPVLRGGTLNLLRSLRLLAIEVDKAAKAWSLLVRHHMAIGIMDSLGKLIATSEKECPHPEWPLIKMLAEKWLDILADSGWVFGRDVWNQPVRNYYEGHTGRPVTGSSFTDRKRIMEKIQVEWGAKGSPLPLVVYAHRRMGKTSILRKLAQSSESEIIMVYISMQGVDCDSIYIEFADSIHSAVKEAGLPVGTPPDEGDFSAPGSGRRALNALLDSLAPQLTGKKRLLLAIDEFEVIKEELEKKHIDEGFLPYLRSCIQVHPWLGLIFAGLHRMDEMGRDYRSAFYSQVEYLRVSYLSRDDVFRLITRPGPDFALEYAPELIDELYRLTYGQPYLVQCLCWELTNRWNKRFLTQREEPRTLTLSHLDEVLNSEFFKAAEYYFDGVWSNVTGNEQILMKVLAEAGEGGRRPGDLEELLTGYPDFREEGAFRETLQLLLRHDVILKEKEGIRFASELMRRWVAEIQC
ncbi:MAG: hypothetical protein GY757_41005, partial [bacterium]|nr:hypothetical protein [bacterium]